MISYSLCGLRAYRQMLKNTYSDLEESKKQYESEVRVILNDLSEMITETDRNISKANEEYRLALEVKESNSAAIERTERSVSDEKSGIANCETRIGNLQSQISNSGENADNSGLYAQIGQVRAEIEGHKREILRLESELSKYRNNVQYLGNLASQINLEIGGLKAYHSDLSSVRDSLSNQLERCSFAHRSAMSRVLSCDSSIDQVMNCAWRFAQTMGKAGVNISDSTEVEFNNNGQELANISSGLKNSINKIARHSEDLDFGLEEYSKSIRDNISGKLSNSTHLIQKQLEKMNELLGEKVQCLWEGYTVLCSYYDLRKY